MPRILGFDGERVNHSHDIISQGLVSQADMCLVTHHMISSSSIPHAHMHAKG